MLTLNLASAKYPVQKASTFHDNPTRPITATDAHVTTCDSRPRSLPRVILTGSLSYRDGRERVEMRTQKTSGYLWTTSRLPVATCGHPHFDDSIGFRCLAIEIDS